MNRRAEPIHDRSAASIMQDISLDECLSILCENARPADEEPVWPEASWQALTQAGVLGWSIAPRHGGLGFDHVALLEGYERLAAACLTTCFLLSQREAAVRRIADMAGDAIQKELLQPLARGDQFATVGLSQLTTSRQHAAPALIAQSTDDGFVLNGIVPWVTGASRADHFLVGATMENGQQILLIVPADSPGAAVCPPLDLMALQGSLTAELRFDEVRVGRRWLLAGPAEKVLTTRRGGAGGLETSCLALGLAGAAIDYLAGESQSRPELGETAAELGLERADVRRVLHALAVHGGDADAATDLRTRANGLVLRATQSALMTAKGAGFLRDHPAQRWARQALFFLVWSCPRPTVMATLARLAK
jgi:alkylation response protein AidB-like acyl-CoA dehydrogenase